MFRNKFIQLRFSLPISRTHVTASDVLLHSLGSNTGVLQHLRASRRGASFGLAFYYGIICIYLSKYILTNLHGDNMFLIYTYIYIHMYIYIYIRILTRLVTNLLWSANEW